MERILSYTLVRLLVIVLQAFLLIVLCYGLICEGLTNVVYNERPTRSFFRRTTEPVILSLPLEEEGVIKELESNDPNLPYIYMEPGVRHSTKYVTKEFRSKVWARREFRCEQTDEEIKKRQEETKPKGNQDAQGKEKATVSA